MGLSPQHPAPRTQHASRVNWHEACSLPFLTSLPMCCRLPHSQVASTFVDPKQRAEYSYLAQQIRLPYWDWAAPYLQ